MYKQEITIYLNPEIITVYLKTENLPKFKTEMFTYKEVEDIFINIYRDSKAYLINAKFILYALNPFCYKVKIEGINGGVFIYEK